MKYKEIAILAFIIIFTYSFGRWSKKCEICEPKEICLPCEPKEIIIKERIIKDLKDEIKNIHITSDRRFRDSLRRAVNPR